MPTFSEITQAWQCLKVVFMSSHTETFETFELKIIKNDLKKFCGGFWRV